MFVKGIQVVVKLSVLAGHAHRFIPLFGTATLIKDQGSAWADQHHPAGGTHETRWIGYGM